MENSDEKQFIFIWTIENFSSCFKLKTEEIPSPKFVVGDLHPKEWYLKLVYTQCVESGIEISCSLHGKNDFKPEFDHVLEIAINADDASVMKTLTCKNNLRLNACNGLKIVLTADNILNAKNDALTIRCIIENKALHHNSKCIAQTKICRDICDFEWPVSVLDTLTFIENIRCHYEFLIQIQDIEDDLDIRVLLGKSEILPFSIKLNVTLLDVKREKMISKTAIGRFDEMRPCTQKFYWNFPPFLKKSDIKAESAKYVKDSFFTLLFELSVSNGSVANQLRYIYPEVNANGRSLKLDTISVLQENYSSLLHNRILSDVKFIIGEEEFPAHRAVLAARSPVLYAMFDQEMKENQTGIIHVVDMDSSTLKHFLDFIYTGRKDKLDFDSTLKLLTAAHKYNVDSLEDVCSFNLKQTTSCENVCELLSTADLTANSFLKSFALDFIRDHPIEVLRSVGWDVWVKSSVELATEVIKMLSVDLTRIPKI